MLRGVVGICNSYDILAMERYTTQYLGGFYQRQLGYYLKHLLNYNKDALRSLESKMGITIEELMKKAKTCRDYESYIMKYIFDYGTPDNYCRKASCVLRLADTTIPMFFLSALDDPIAPYINITT
jgi:predicted alpha/beta-fold hydrolase